MKTTLPRIYLPLSLRCDSSIELTDEAFQHVVKSLRMREGEPLIIFNGQGGEYHGILQSVTKKTAKVELVKFIEISRESAPYIHLGQCLSRNERMDYAIQKAVEVGVSEITPVLSTRCQSRIPPERLAKRMAHWQQIIISACEQCGRTFIPKLNEPQRLAEWVDLAQGIKLICDWGVQAWDQQARLEKVSLLIGPEGGFTEKEQNQAVTRGFQGVLLGNRVLRTETAPVVAITLLQSIVRNQG